MKYELSGIIKIWFCIAFIYFPKNINKYSIKYITHLGGILK